MKKATCLNDIISVNADFKNAINLYLNLNDKDKILSYIPTKSSISMLNTYLESIYYNKNNASILVGPYGKGKSHLLLLVMAIASLDRNEQNEKVLEELKDRIKIADAENAAGYMERFWPAGIAFKLQRASLLKHHGKMAHFIHEAVTGFIPFPIFSCYKITIPNPKSRIHPQRIAAVKFLLEEVTGSLLQRWLLPAV